MFPADYPDAYLSQISLSLLAIAVVYIFINIFLGEIVFKHIHDEKTRYTANRVSSILSLLVILIAFVRIWFADAGSLILSLGVIGAGVAIALQDVFKNFVGGIIIITARPYEVGDRMMIGGDAVM